MKLAVSKIAWFCFLHKKCRIFGQNRNKFMFLWLSIFYNFKKINFLEDKNVHTASNRVAHYVARIVHRWKDQIHIFKHVNRPRNLILIYPYDASVSDRYTSDTLFPVVFWAPLGKGRIQIQIQYILIRNTALHIFLYSAYKTNLY